MGLPELGLSTLWGVLWAWDSCGEGLLPNGMGDVQIKERKEDGTKWVIRWPQKAGHQSLLSVTIDKSVGIRDAEEWVWGSEMSLNMSKV